MEALARRAKVNLRTRTASSVRRFRLCKSAEEAAVLPGRWLRCVCDTNRQFEKDGIKLGRCGTINRLAEIIGNTVVSIRVPIFEDLLFRVSRQITEFECHSGDSFFHKTVLITADESIPVRFLVSLDFYTRGLSHSPDVIPQCRLVQALPLEPLQRKQRKEHVHVEVSHNFPL